MDCTEELVWVPSAGLKLAGVLHTPAGNFKPKPVMLLHGFTGNKSEAGRLFVDLARALCSIGYAVLRFDFRCHGDSPLPFEEFSVWKAVEDAENAVEYLKSMDSLDASRLALVGLSMGGGIAVKVAVKRFDVSALVLMSAGLDWLELWPLRGHVSRIVLEGGYAYEGWSRMRLEQLRDSLRFSVMDAAERVQAPTLMIHAVDDTLVPIDHARRFYERLKTERKFIEVKGGHVFNGYHLRRLIISEIVEWLRKHL